MTRIGRAIVEAIIHEHGRSELLSRLSDPFWFQALGCVMGMDWHSSGITTSVLGALKRAVNPLSDEFGVMICGGRGKHSRKTPEELEAYASLQGLDSSMLVRASRLSAKVDNTCVQDGFSLYLHSFIVTREGAWTVVQQGMNDATSTARRYHWHSSLVKSFVEDPQAAVVGPHRGNIINLSDTRAGRARDGIIDFLKQHPDRQLRELKHLVMDRSHAVLGKHLSSKRLGAVLTTAYEKGLSRFTDALLLPGVGPRTIQSLALVSEVVYGSPSRFSDPARFSFAHGGKDGHPFPVPLHIYDKSIQVLRSAVECAKLGRSDKLEGLKKLHGLTLHVEKNVDARADVEKVVRHERAHSKQWGGRTVFDLPPSREKDPASGPDAEQLSLF